VFARLQQRKNNEDIYDNDITRDMKVRTVSENNQESKERNEFMRRSIS